MKASDITGSRVGQYSIHDETSIEFMRKLNPGSEVLKIMEEGYRLPFTTVEENIPRYYEANNKSCEKHIEVVMKKIKMWEQQQFIAKVPEKPHVCSPLSVSEKMDYLTGEVKFRPCLDASRHLNKYLKLNKVKLEDLDVSEKMMKHKDYMTAFDLMNCYFHVRIVPEHWKYLGFSITYKGTKMYYVFKILIYGISPAVTVITELTKPLITLLHSRGIRISILIDDGKVLADTAEKAWNHHEHAIKVFQRAGWNIQVSKTSTEATQLLYHQGYYINSLDMTYKISDVKLQTIITNMLDLKKCCTLKELAKITGKLMSIRKATGPIVRLSLYYSFRLMSDQIKKYGDEAWKMVVNLPEEVLNELNFIMISLPEWNGFKIINTKHGQCINKAIEGDDIGEVCRMLLPDESLIISDASEFRCASYELFFGNYEVYLEDFTATQAEMSSSSRELQSVEMTIRKSKIKLMMRNISNIYWVTDSRVLQSWLTAGSGIESVQKRLQELFKELHAMGCIIIPIWSPRDTRMISMADQLSKLQQSTDEWGIQQKYIRMLEKLAGYQVDCDVFASFLNRRTQKYYSKLAEVESAGVNAFMQNWGENKYNYVCPPVSMAIETYRKIAEEPSRGIVILPCWKRNPFWPVITFDGIHLKGEFTKFHDFRARVTTGILCCGTQSKFNHGETKMFMALFYDSTSNVTTSLRSRCTLNGCGKCMN